VFVDDRPKPAGDGVERLIPRDTLIASGGIAHMRMKDAAAQSECLAQRRALRAEPAEIGRVVGVARDRGSAVAIGRGQHAAADAAIRAGRADGGLGLAGIGIAWDWAGVIDAHQAASLTQ